MVDAIARKKSSLFSSHEKQLLQKRSRPERNGMGLVSRTQESTSEPASAGSADGRPYAFTPHEWVTMSDGTRLSVCRWTPASEDGPWPAVLEIIPYRKRDHTAQRDSQTHSVLARRGFATLRADMRGHGDSEGLHDAYRTYEDTQELIQWIRRQPWSNGRVAMLGLSWGGTNAFMAAHRRTEGLAAIVTTASSADRYGVGMLWKNGCLLNENLGWVTSLTAFSTRPPDPLIVGPEWRAIWLRRLSEHRPETPDMLARAVRDDYWDRHVASGIDQSSAAIYMFSGWADNNYAQTPPTLLPRLKCPAAAVIGPWGHRYPHFGYPGPAIDFLGELTAWLDRHLRGNTAAPERTGLTVYIPEDSPANANASSVNGRWVALAGVPTAPATRRLAFAQGRLTEEGAGDAGISHHLSPLATGARSGEVMPWFAIGPGPELPDDQREDDGKSLCFDGEPLSEPLTYVGRPRLTLEFSVDRPVSFLAVRLCDVKPDGASARVCLGLFNLNQRPEAGGSERDPKPLEPGKRYRFELDLDFSAYRFLNGHRLRLAFSTSYWPIVWPSPEPVTLTVHHSGCSFDLPLHDPADERAPPEFGPPVIGDSLARVEHRPPQRRRQVLSNLVDGSTTMCIEEVNGPYTYTDIDWTVSSRVTEDYRVDGNDPSSASVTIDWEWRFERQDWSATTRVRSSLKCDTSRLYCRIELEALEADRAFYSNGWDYTIPRRLS